jgi:hypothetical protein
MMAMVRIDSLTPAQTAAQIKKTREALAELDAEIVKFSALPPAELVGKFGKASGRMVTARSAVRGLTRQRDDRLRELVALGAWQGELEMKGATA